MGERPSITFASKHLADKEDLVIAEIGIWVCGNAIRMYEEFKDRLRLFYLVDPFSHNNYDNPSNESNLRQALEVMRSSFNRDKIRFIQKRSVEGALEAESRGDRFDFVYIDANHSYEMVMLDLIMWYPLVKEGGILAGHDYRTVDQVALAVNDFLKYSNRQVHKLYCKDTTGDPIDWWFVKEGEADYGYI